MLWLGAGAIFGCAFLRVYRSHSVLLRHNGVMWPVLLQLGITIMPLVLTPVALTSGAGSLVIDEETNECERDSEMPEAIAVGFIALLAAATAALTCRLQAVRSQAPEESSAALSTTVVVLAATVGLPLLHAGLEAERDERRRAMLVVSSLTSVAIVALPLWGAVASFVLARDHEMVASGDFGSNRIHQPEDLQKITQDRMKVKTLESSPEGRNMPESSKMASFFSDSLDRDCVRDYFLLQASTMRILDRYIREGAPAYIPLSSICKEEMLTSRASSAFIFETARQEVMALMGGGALTYRISLSDTFPFGKGVPGDKVGGNGSGPGTPFSLPPSPPNSKSQQQQQKLPPGAFPAKAQPRPRGAKTAGRAAVSGGEIKRHGLGGLGGGTSELLAAFGLRSDAKVGSESEENTPRETLHGLGFARNVEDGQSGEGHDPLDQDERPRQGGEAAPGSLDDLDPYMGLQGDLDFNYSESLASIATLENDTGLQSGSSSEGREDKSDEDDEDGQGNEEDSDEDGHARQSDEDDDGGEVIVVVNPLFVHEELKDGSR
ncbi:unnamed protein product [Ectocarpus fasciculatus]